ncbi:hypothetical protein [Aureimonas sp. ME7]|uniref:hypothetical protein n=1 Tax=Aureimonas sp. ME7 TaxID=2744252 RepID=UPI0015F4E0A6|nr:hypothetical protein [Aureimonas sp. ME7]
MPIFIVGAKSDTEELWMVDTDAGTVRKVDADAGAAEGSDAPTLQSLRRNGYTVIRDVDVAVLVGQSDQPVSRQFTD